MKAALSVQARSEKIPTDVTRPASAEVLFLPEVKISER